MEAIRITIPTFWVGFCTGGVSGIGLLVILAYVMAGRKRK